ncbi:hypothetical protein Tco_0469076 [Tanacetum coccineum]
MHSSGILLKKMVQSIGRQFYAGQERTISLTLDFFNNLSTTNKINTANDNNHNSFVPPPSFSDMVPFYKQQLGFTMELKTSSSFKTTGLLQPCPNVNGKIFSNIDKESPEVEITNDEEVEITNVVIPVNVNEEEDEITDEVYELKRREKGKIVEESRNTQFPLN